ncbi:hypothetical protein B0T25DRAFT_223249 [Lasiosphaeria hispida]|uniref:Uncharacterized protein n=1 Tax=Lasiosphaeria hispida TaxID=260671 RepID=A0AAJ0HJZ5_9PEZI|nr:hypothetical protein B0T25DRAFT_223249 [Lasiosphaeria hispida]
MSAAPAPNDSGPAPPPAFGDEPPTYREQRDDPEEVVLPTAYTLHGRFVYADPNSTSPVYELSRVIHTQGPATTNIEFHRLDYRVRTATDGTPNVSHRGKHIYNLGRVTPIFEISAEYSLECLSRKGLGDVTLKKRSFPYSGYRAAKRLSDRELESGKKLPKNDHHFTVREGEHGFEWSDAGGRVVATQDGPSLGGDESQHKLVVSVPLSRRTMDGLVALWCLWLWHLHATGAPRQKKGWKHFKMIMERPSGGTSMKILK